MSPLLLWQRTAYLAALPAVAAVALGCASGAKSGVVEYEMQMRIGSQRVPTFQQKIWFKGEKFRSELSTPAGKQIHIGGPDGMVLHRPGSGRVTEIPVRRSSGKGGRHRMRGIPGVPFSDVAEIRANWQKVGSERVAGHIADIYEPRFHRVQATPGVQRFTNRVWVSRDLPIPVKTVSMGPNFESVTTLKSAQFGVPVSDSLFQR
jgi:hypothetical protein